MSSINDRALGAADYRADSQSTSPTRTRPAGLGVA
jgi:hypothetical protein